MHNRTIKYAGKLNKCRLFLCTVTTTSRVFSSAYIIRLTLLFCTVSVSLSLYYLCLSPSAVGVKLLQYCLVLKLELQQGQDTLEVLLWRDAVCFNY